MEHEILDLIDRYWKFDNDQTPVSSWHDKQNLLEAVRKSLRKHDVSGDLAVGECKCIRFAGGDKWYPNGCNIHPNG